MSLRVFLLAALAQAVLVAALFAVLLVLPLPEGFFRVYGWAVGPLAWLGCALVAGRLRGLRFDRSLVAGLASGAAAGVVGAGVGHGAGMAAGVLAFGAGAAVRLGSDSARPQRKRAEGSRAPSAQ